MKILRITLLVSGLVALAAAVLLGPPQSAQSSSARPSTPTTTPCPACSTPAPTPTPSCSCTPTPTATLPPNIPLNDLGSGTYRRAPGTWGSKGGLYKGSNQ